MALRDQPYIPLYVDDYLTDEKLNMCSASTQGVYIKILCILHKQTEYGKLLLKQKEKQYSNICLNFAAKFAKILPFTIDVILPAIEELIEEEILIVDGDYIYQKRMIKDNYLSLIKANNGSKGGKKTQEKNKDFAKAKNEANTVIEYVNENVISLTNSSNNTNEPNFEKLESTPYTPEKKYSDDEVIEQFKNHKIEFLKQQHANEQFCMSKRIPFESLESVLNDFNTSKIGDGQTPSKNLAEYRKWVSNWFNKIPEDIKANYRKRKRQVNN